MQTLDLQPDGTLIKRGKPVTGQVMKLLGHSIRFEPGVFLGSVFMMLDKYPDFLILSDMLPTLFSLAAQAHMPGAKSEEIDHLVFYKTIEIKGFPGKPSLMFYNSLKGSSASRYVDLKFFHLETLVAHQLKLGNLEHIVFGDREDRFSYDTFYTLFELIESIAWELSFNFNPLECSIRR
jgi:hypothetical protein